MTATTIRVQMAQRKDTAAGWTAANPILLLGEIGYETDAKKFKIGDGTTNWNSLAYLPIPDGSGNLTITGNLEIGTTGSLTFEGSTANGFETTLAVTDPTADRTITLPDVTGTVVTTGDTGTVTSTMIADGTIVDGDVNASAAIAGTKISPNFGSQNVVTTGTSTAASFIPTSSSVPTNGVYLPSANNVAISTNSSQRLLIDASGNVNIDSNTLYVDATNNRVGLGTSSPQRPFDVVSNSSAETATFRGRSSDNIGTIRFSSNDAGTNYASIQSRPAYFEISTAASIPLLLNPGSGTGVGIGVTTPGSFFSGANQLVVGSGSGAQGITIYSASNDNAQIFFSDGTTGDQQYRGIVRYKHDEDAMTFSTAGANEAFRVDSSRRLLVGTSTSRAVSDSSGNGPQGRIQIEAANSDALMSIISAGTADAFRAGTLSLGRHRNSTVGGTPTVVQSGDTLGAICFAGGDGTDMLANGASITCQVDGTPGSDDMPGRLVFSVTADGASSPTEAMRIKNSRIINIANTPVYADNAAAKTGGLVDGDVYRTSTGDLKIVYT
jgi:hypothetical protein